MADQNKTQTPSQSKDEETSQQAKAQQEQKGTPELKEQNPADKFPTLVPLVKKLEQERNEIQKKSDPLRKQREELIKEIQPLEAKLRKLDEKIKDIERPRLPQINNEIAALAKAMGGRAMSQSNI
jgi:chromosome segregation ATPase